MKSEVTSGYFKDIVALLKEKNEAKTYLGGNKQEWLRVRHGIFENGISYVLCYDKIYDI